MSIAAIAKATTPPGPQGADAAKFGDHLLHSQRVLALDKFAELVKRRLQCTDEPAAECGNADTLDAVIGKDLYSEEFAQHAGHRRGTD
jgi:hypothetical protein